MPENPPPKPPPQQSPESIRRAVHALNQITNLMERHSAAGDLTVPVRAIYAVLRDAGYGNAHLQQQLQQRAKRAEVKAEQPEQNRGMRL
jgi:hypothetical protein